MRPELPADCAERFEHVRALARGGFGAVHLAIHRTLGHQVAIKVLLAAAAEQAEAAQRFENEARITASVRHPNVVEVLDFGAGEGVPWIALEFVAGKSLRALLEEHPRGLEPTLALDVAARVADALAAAHAQGVLHRDIKPDNILLSEAGEVRVTDFGIAKWTRDGAVHTRTGVIMGTPVYMAPEVVEGAPASVATDLYALGVMLFEMLTGRPPFAVEGSPMLVLEMHVRAPVPRVGERVPALSAAVDALVCELLAKRPDARPVSAAALRDRLHALLDAPTRAPAGGSTVAVSVPVAKPSARTVAVERPAAARGPRAAAAPARSAAGAMFAAATCFALLLGARIWSGGGGGSASPSPTPSPSTVSSPAASPASRAAADAVERDRVIERIFELGEQIATLTGERLKVVDLADEAARTDACLRGDRLQKKALGLARQLATALGQAGRLMAGTDLLAVENVVHQAALHLATQAEELRVLRDLRRFDNSEMIQAASELNTALGARALGPYGPVLAAATSPVLKAVCKLKSRSEPAEASGANSAGILVKSAAGDDMLGLASRIELHHRRGELLSKQVTGTRRRVVELGRDFLRRIRERSVFEPPLGLEVLVEMHVRDAVDDLMHDALQLALTCAEPEREGVDAVAVAVDAAHTGGAFLWLSPDDAARYGLSRPELVERVRSRFDGKLPAELQHELDDLFGARQAIARAVGAHLLHPRGDSRFRSIDALLDAIHELGPVESLSDLRFQLRAIKLRNAVGIALEKVDGAEKAIPGFDTRLGKTLLRLHDVLCATLSALARRAACPTDTVFTLMNSVVALKDTPWPDPPSTEQVRARAELDAWRARSPVWQPRALLALITVPAAGLVAARPRLLDAVDVYDRDVMHAAATSGRAGLVLMWLYLHQSLPWRAVPFDATRCAELQRRYEERCRELGDGMDYARWLAIRNELAPDPAQGPTRK